jgi:uncharacterized protein (TIGR03437 family)
MFNRNVTLAAVVCIAAGVAAFGQPGAGFVFQLPGTGSSSVQIVGYPYAANPLTGNVSAGGVNASGPTGTYQIIGKPDGTGFYVLGSTLQVANNGFTTFSTINAISSTPTAAAASPDGNYLIAGAGEAYIISASSYQVVGTASTSGTIVGIAISQDSKYAYVLTNTFTSSTVTQISIPSGTVVATLPFEYGGATSIAFSPLNLLYVGATNRIYEINPTTLQITQPSGTMTPNATPGPLHFTPDGTTLYFANTSSAATGGSGGSIVQITLATYQIVTWPNNGTSAIPINDVLVAGNSRIFAISYSTTTLFDVSTSPLGMAVSTLNNVLNNQAQNVVAAAVSTELPSALYLYLVVNGTSGQNVLYRINLANNTVSGQVSAVEYGGTLEFVGVPPSPPNAAVGSFIQYNSTQTVVQSATSLPLIAQILDLTGRPVFNQPVTFTTPSSNGIAITNPSPTTNANGYVSTIITAPAVAGTYTITLTAGAANTSFTITVPGTGVTNPTGPTGVQQVTIVSGNGQLVPSNYSSENYSYVTNSCIGDPLTILVTDVNGVPIPNVQVNWSVTSGTGNVSNYSTCANTLVGLTDSTGQAYATFQASLPNGQYDFEQDTVVASTSFGSVSFTEVVYAFNPNPSFNEFPPSILLQTPTIDSDYNINVPEGGVVSNGVTAIILANSTPQLNCPAFQSGYPGDPLIVSCPMPGVSIRIVDPVTNNQSPYASCQGSTLSDQTGVAHCNVVPSCGVPLGSHQVIYTVGDVLWGYQRLGTVNITQGSAQSLSIASGNNKSGPAGQLLPTPLIATVTDGCGNPVSGAQVSWSVTQGSATLSKVVSTSGSNGQVSASITFGQAPGTVVVTVTFASSSTATFTLTSQSVVSTMNILNGNNQTVTEGSTFPQSLTVQILDVSNNPITGQTVNFAVTTGTGSVNPAAATTDSQGRASTIVTASSNPGSLVVTASYASVSATFSLVVVPPGPQVAAANFQNAASFQSGLVPCGLATATGSGLAPGITGTISGASFLASLPYTLNGLSLTVNGTPAPIYQISNTNGKQQVTFQTPCEVSPTSNGTVVIQLNGGTTTVNNITILQAQPGIFNSIGSNGTAYGEVLDSNGNYVTATNPAKRGSNYYLIATGLGQVTPPAATDSVGINGQNVNYQVIVGVSNLGVPVLESIYQPGAVGIYIIEFTIPLTNPSGVDQPLALAVVVNGQTIFGNLVYLNSVQ